MSRFVVGRFDVIEPQHGTETAEEWASGKMGYVDPYDAVFMYQVIEHLTDPLLVVQAIRRAVKPNGYFVCSTPSTRSLECWLLGKRWDAYDRPDHRHWFNPTSLRLLLWYAGFTRVTVYHQRVVKHVRGPKWFTTLLGCLVAALRLSSRVTVVARP